MTQTQKQIAEGILRKHFKEGDHFDYSWLKGNGPLSKVIAAIAEALDTGAKQREVLIHEHSLLYSLNEKKFQEIQFGGLGISDQQSFSQQVNAAIAMAWECVELRKKLEALSLQGNAPRWVKADPENETNLPALGFDVFVKFTDYEGGNHKGIGCLDNTIHGRRIKWGIGYGGCLLSNMVTLEWLDESPSMKEAEKSEGVDFAEWLLQNCTVNGTHDYVYKGQSYTPKQVYHIYQQSSAEAIRVQPDNKEKTI